MKSFKMMMMAATAFLALLVTTCGSAPASKPQRSSAPQQEAPDLSKAQRASDEARQTAAPKKTLDWKNRSLGVDSAPAWLYLAASENWLTLKREWNITGKRLRMGYGEADTLPAAQTIADVQYLAAIARGFKTAVNVEMSNALQRGQFAATNDAVTKTNIDITGQERLTDHWDLIELTDPQGRTIRKYEYWVIYACDDAVWDKLSAKYVYDVVDKVPDRETKQKVASMFQEINERSKKEEETSEQVFREEVRAQLQAIQKPMSVEEQQVAYSSGDRVKIAAASVTKADTDYITMLAALAGVN